MSTKGIIFSASMVRALIAGTKTQTRRLLTPGTAAFGSAPKEYWPHGAFDRAFPDASYLHVPAHYGYCAVCDESGWDGTVHRLYPYISKGDRLYVREGWAVKRCEPCLDHERDWQSLHGPTLRYLADGAEIEHCGDRLTGRGIYHGPVEKGRSPIHMPRWASRLWLDVTEVRVERLQSISTEDCNAEGMEEPGFWDQVAAGEPWSARRAYRDLWNTLHTEPGTRWEDDPWVVAVSFAVHHGNVDEVGHG